MTAIAPTTRTALVESLMERFPHVPREAVLKEDLLRTGIAFDESALSDNLDGEVKPKSYFIFSFDQKPLAELGEAARRRPPEELALTGGPYELRRTIVSVRVNPGSPYRVARAEDGALALALEGRAIADVGLPPMPEYYRHTLANGKTVMETAPTIQWGYLVYLTVLRLCQYFGAKEECGFCDINHNWRQHKREGRPYTGVKPVADVLEALALIDRYDTDRTSKAYTLTGGSVTSTVDGLAEADFYGRYAQAIEERFPGRWIGKVVAQALPKADVQRYKDYGITIYHPNYEVWDKRLFELISPGKQRYVGREEWHRRILDAADVFGSRYVIPNFVAGVEMARPHGFATVDEAIASTTEGLDWFMSRGITPRFTTWCPEPTTPLGRDNPDGAPLEYHIRLLEAYRDALGRHGLQAAARLRRRGCRERGLLGQLVHGHARSRRKSPSRRRCPREPDLGRGGGAALARGGRRRAPRARAGRTRALARARSRHVHGDADRQLHERLRRPVRLLRVLRAPERGRRLRARSRRGLREDRRAARGRR